MIGQLKDVYTQLGLGWDETNLASSKTYGAEIEYAAYYNEGVRDELFPNHTHSQFYLDLQTRQAEKKRKDAAAAQENASKVIVQRQLDLEKQEQEKAEAAAQKKWHAHQQVIDDFARMTKAERKEEFDKYSPEMIRTIIENQSPEHNEQWIGMMTPTQRKRFGVKTLEETMRKNLGGRKILKPIK